LSGVVWAIPATGKKATMMAMMTWIEIFIHAHDDAGPGNPPGSTQKALRTRWRNSQGRGDGSIPASFEASKAANRSASN